MSQAAGRERYLKSLTSNKASDTFLRLPDLPNGLSLRSVNRFGGLAQLGERLAGSQKVRGSSPLSSTH